jgi:hypothetical protein
MLLHFGTADRKSMSWVSYLVQVIFASLVAAVLGLLLLISLLWALTGELL